MAGWLIGEVAHRAGVTASTVRYYEEIGLLPAPSRSSAGYRRYSEVTVDELRFIRKAQAIGFSLDEIRGILNLSRSGKAPCSHVLSLAQQHLAAVDERIRQLQRFRNQLAREVAKWDGKNTPTCEGLCQFIAATQIDSAEEKPQARLNHTHPKRRKSRGLRACLGNHAAARG